VKCCVELLTKYSKYGALKVLENKLIISFSNMRGLTCAATSLHLRAYSLIDSLSFSIACKPNRSGPTSILNLYCLMKASTKSFHFFNLGIVQPHIPSEGSVTQAFLKEMNQQFLIINHLSHFVVVCFEMSYKALSSHIFDKFWHSKLFGMTTLGTKHILAAFIGSYRRIPSNALILCSRATNLFRPSSFTILPF